MELNINAAYKAVEILNIEGDLSIEYIGCDEQLKNKFMASSCGLSCYGSTALEAAIQLFWSKHPNLRLDFFTNT